MMRFHDLRQRHGYEKLSREEDCYDENKEKVIKSSSSPSSSSSSSSSPTPRRRCFWVKKMNGKGKLIRGVKISRCRRVVNLKRFSLVLFPRKIGRIYSEIVKRLIELDGSSIIFATTWGIPVLSNNLS
ncbi:unnamed protein product [Amaranthus hypochondriacus]